MKRILAVALLVAMGLGVLTLVPGTAWAAHHGFQHRVFIGVGPYWWGPPYWYYPPPYYAYPPPPVVIQQPPVYVQPPPTYVQPEPAPPAPPQSYWYYCPGAKAYYPNVQSCGEAWIKVPARPQ